MGDGVEEDSKGQEKDKEIRPYFGREEQNLKILRKEFRNDVRQEETAGRSEDAPVLSLFETEGVGGGRRRDALSKWIGEKQVQIWLST